MKTGYEITKPSTGKEMVREIKHLNCPLCRRTHMGRRKGTMVILRGGERKKVPADFAVCGYCHITATIEEVPFSHVLIFGETFFPGDKCIEVSIN